ncbi:hypothetical protein SAMN05444166_5050 [Singulisphaera sp. GP187]|nr:hypothetical protein SAMN05444166_5050 [Singulisphaera sp. GP187]
MKDGAIVSDGNRYGYCTNSRSSLQNRQVVSKGVRNPRSYRPGSVSAESENLALRLSRGLGRWVTIAPAEFKRARRVTRNKFTHQRQCASTNVYRSGLIPLNIAFKRLSALRTIDCDTGPAGVSFPSRVTLASIHLISSVVSRTGNRRFAYRYCSHLKSYNQMQVKFAKKPKAEVDTSRSPLSP